MAHAGIVFSIECKKVHRILCIRVPVKVFSRVRDSLSLSHPRERERESQLAVIDVFLIHIRIGRAAHPPINRRLSHARGFSLACARAWPTITHDYKCSRNEAIYETAITSSPWNRLTCFAISQPDVCRFVTQQSVSACVLSRSDLSND